jgi:hypothetical protein
LSEFIDIDNGILIVWEFLRAIYSVNILQKRLQCHDQLLVSRTGRELHGFDDVWPDWRGRIRDNVGHKIPSREIIKGSRKVSMGGWHDKWHISRGLRFLGIRRLIFNPNGGFYSVDGTRMSNRLMEFLDVLRVVIPILFP